MTKKFAKAPKNQIDYIYKKNNTKGVDKLVAGGGY